MGFCEYKSIIDSLFAKFEKKTALKKIKNGEIFSYTYGDIRDVCLKLSGITKGLSLDNGEGIAIISSSTADSLLAYYAVTYQHMTAVFIKPSMPKEELVHSIEKCDVSLVLTDRTIYSSKLSDNNYTVYDIEDACFEPITENKKMTPCNALEKDVALFLFSSGTSGTPKPVMITYDAVLHGKKLMIQSSDTSEKESLLCAFPIFHAGGFFSVFSMSLMGGTVNTVENYSIEKTTEYMRIFQPTHFGMIPSVIENLFISMEQSVKNKGNLHYKCFKTAGKLSLFARKHFGLRKISRLLMRPYYKDTFGSRMRCIFVGAMKADDELARKTQKYGFDWYNAYTCTECCCPIVTTVAYNGYSEFSNGKIDWNREIEVKLAEPDDNGVGEILVRTPLIMKGYFGDKKATENAFDENGFYKTGDLAYVDKNKNLHIVGRISEIIHLHNGEKLAPEMLEASLSSCFNDSNRAVVCGIPSKDGSYDEIHIFIEDKGYSEEGKKLLNDKLGLAADIYPIKDIHYIARIPYTDLHKPKRFELSKSVSTDSPSIAEPDTPFEYFMWLVRRYTTLNTLDTDKAISDAGLDSLSVYSVAARMEERFGIKIIPMLSNAATFGELKKMIESGEVDTPKPVVLRKILKSELREMSVFRTECMMDYPLYGIFYSDTKRRRRQLLYTSWYMLYRHYPFTYVNEEKTVLFSMKKPGDVYKSPIGLFINPRFLFGIISCATIDCLKKIHSYLKIEEETEKRYFDPLKDYYVCYMCVDPKVRGKGIYDSLMSMLDINNRYYFVTHSEKNVRLYEKYGAKICETAEWNGIKLYCLIKHPVKNIKSKNTESAGLI